MRLFFLVLTVCASTLIFGQSNDNALSKSEKKKGWILLFNGTDFSGWTTPSGNQVTKGWEASGGSLSTIKGGKGGDIVTKDEYDNFIFTLQYKLEPACNSGVKYFYTRYTNGGNLGLEFQLLDDELAEDNKLNNHLCGSLYDILAPQKKPKINPPGQWNTIKIVSKDKKVEHWINGKLVLKFTRGDASFTQAVSKSKFNKVVPAFGTVPKGKILLQEHGGVIAFKNIKIKKL